VRRARRSERRSFWPGRAAGRRRAVGEFAEAFDDFRVEPETFFDLGDRVLGATPSRPWKTVSPLLT
jgi:hypothetical protein